MNTVSARAIDLAPLAGALDSARIEGDMERVVLAIAHDSRSVRPGALFVALRGERVDGHAFVERAVTAGARAVVVDEAYAAQHPIIEGATRVVVGDTRLALSRLAAAFYGNPARSLLIAGITGTNGKTTTAHLTAAALNAGGVPAGRIGTLGAAYGGAMWSLDNTTPLSLELQALLAEMRDRGAEAVAMEVSSHALALDRVADVTFAIGVLTNVTRDHLDFHASVDAYAAAKRSLFDRSLEAALNVDDAWGRRWTSELRARGGTPLTYGFAEDASVRATSFEGNAAESSFSVGVCSFKLRLPGRFNVQNALAALCVARAFGVDDGATARAFAEFEAMPGRMERLSGGGIDVLVDYAHTPDALAAVLQAARETARGALIVVFGCGGDRDSGKRPEMGRVASFTADRVFVTSDNPRGEDPRAIADAILGGIVDRRHVLVELDRRAAIRAAIAGAVAGDVVVVAGKGHETYQVTATGTNHFDDRDEVRAALAARGGGPQ